MKVFRDLFAAILIGIIGGFAFSVVSYYQEHKEGGLRETANAIINSFDVVANVYANGEDSVYAASAQLQNEDDELAFDGILRFHVRANSDDEKDQEVKMAVKEDVLHFLKPKLDSCKTVEESKQVIVDNLQNIYTIAVDTLTEQGFDDSVMVYMTTEDFPAKQYGDVTLPAGEYEALRIDIGEAKGKNWWCIMFPPLCFIDESTAVITQEGKEELRRALTEEEFQMLLQGGLEENNISVREESYIYNWLKG